MTDKPLIARLSDRLLQTKVGTWYILNISTRLDPLLLRLTGGRFASGHLVGFPSMLLLTTTGAKSGLAREVTLMYIKDGERLALIASNGGMKKHPAWYHNLKANPRAEVILHGYSGTYAAREAEGAERDRLWEMARQTFTGFDRYEQRAGERQIPVMVLEPVYTK